ncbi:hypothetical protein ECTW07945_0982, partial [Escherichia coli TW07945]
MASKPPSLNFMKSREVNGHFSSRPLPSLHKPSG